MLAIFNILFPVFGLIGFGVLLRYTGILDAAMEKAFNTFCYFVALPVFIFVKAAQSPTLDGEALKSAGALSLVTLGLLICSAIGAKLFRIPSRALGTFVHASFRGNLAYIGLPVILFALREAPASLQAKAETLTILSMAPGVFLYNLLGVGVLEWDRRHERTGHPLRACCLSTIRNPLILSCFAGFSWNALALPLPDLGLRMATPVAQTAFPLALLSIGSRISALSWRKGLGAGLGVLLMKNGLGLLLGLGVTRLLGLEGVGRLVILVLSTCPTAVASYVLVDQLDGDRELAASAISVTHLGSVIALAAALWLGYPL
ncbi:MAG: AEC family transporter [Kiritimatiellia bacterium]